MPTNVPRGSDGFEIPNAFFNTPADGLTTAKTSRVRKDFDTPGGVSAFITPSAAGKKGRMSALMASDDEEEDGSQMGQGLLDEEDVLEPRELCYTVKLLANIGWQTCHLLDRTLLEIVRNLLNRHGPSLNSYAETPSVTLPRRSKPVAPSPSVDFENLPTPKARDARRSSRHNPSPGMALTGRKSQNALGSPIMDEEDFSMGDNFGDFGGDDLDLGNTSAGNLSAASKSSTKSPATLRKRNPAPRISDEEEADEVERDVGVANGSMSDDGASDVGADAGFDFGGDDTVEAQADESDEGAALAREIEAIGSDDEADAQAEEDGAGPKKRGRKSKTKSAPRQEYNAPMRSQTFHEVREKEKKKSRISRFGVGEQRGCLVPTGYLADALTVEENGEYEGDFVCRRSGRRHFKPLKYWQGEHFEFEKGQYQPAIAEVVHVPEMPAEYLGSKRKRSGRSRSNKPSRGDTVDTGNGRWGEEEGWDHETEPVGIVKDFITSNEIQRRESYTAAYPGFCKLRADGLVSGIAYPRQRLEPKEVAGGSFKYQKVFGEDMFIAAGVVYVPVKSSKPGKLSRDNAYVSHRSVRSDWNADQNLAGILCYCWCCTGHCASD